jgi:hypothetical protein
MLAENKNAIYSILPSGILIKDILLSVVVQSVVLLAIDPIADLQCVIMVMSSFKMPFCRVSSECNPAGCHSVE